MWKKKNCHVRYFCSGGGGSPCSEKVQTDKQTPFYFLEENPLETIDRYWSLSIYPFPLHFTVTSPHLSAPRKLPPPVRVQTTHLELVARFLSYKKTMQKPALPSSSRTPLPFSPFSSLKHQARKSYLISCIHFHYFNILLSPSPPLILTLTLFLSILLLHKTFWRVLVSLNYQKFQPWDFSDHGVRFTNPWQRSISALTAQRPISEQMSKVIKFRFLDYEFGDEFDSF